jgi:hypothetical protein
VFQVPAPSALPEALFQDELDALLAILGTLGKIAVLGVLIDVGCFCRRTTRLVARSYFDVAHCMAVSIWGNKVALPLRTSMWQWRNWLHFTLCW